MPHLDLPTQYRHLICDLLATHVPGAEVLVYGSRITGHAHPGSDLDLVVRQPDRPNDPQPRLQVLSAALAESNLPILVEVHDGARLPDQMRRDIERAHVIIASPLSADVVAETPAQYRPDKSRH